MTAQNEQSMAKEHPVTITVNRRDVVPPGSQDFRDSTGLKQP